MELQFAVTKPGEAIPRASTSNPLVAAFQAAVEAGARLDTTGLQLGWEKPRAYTKQQRVAGGSTRLPVTMMSYQFVVDDVTAFTAHIDAQSATVTLPGTDLQLQVKYDGVQLRLFELSGVQGIGPQHWAAAMRQKGYPVLRADWARDRAGTPYVDAVRLAMAVTGAAPSSVRVVGADGAPLDIIMREVTASTCPDINLRTFESVYAAKLAIDRQQETEQQQQQQRILQSRQQRQQQQQQQWEQQQQQQRQQQQRQPQDAV